MLLVRNRISLGNFERTKSVIKKGWSWPRRESKKMEQNVKQEAQNVRQDIEFENKNLRTKVMKFRKWRANAQNIKPPIAC